MTITILALDPDPTAPVVHFASPVGNGSGLWNSEEIDPELQAEFDIDLDLPRALTPDDYTVLPDAAKPSLTIVITGLRLIAPIVHVNAGPDGITLALRLTDGDVLLVGHDGPPPSVGSTLQLFLGPDELALTPADE